MSLVLSSLKTTFFIAFTTLLLMVSNHAQADTDKAQVVLVLDGSGSMWGRIKGRPKISIAQDVIGGLMKNWDKDIELGLVFYGHRRRGDCKDIEVMLKPQRGNSARVQKLVKGIKPKGKTPISQSVLTAAKTLKYTKQRATVILVSDGQETCTKVDPCEMARELEKRGADFTTHVIGFDVNKKTAKQLECMARATGGMYRDAKSADKLQDALKDAVESVKREGYDSVIATLGRGQAPFTDPRLSWGVFARNEPRVELSSKVTNKLELHVEPGQYIVEARIDGHKKRAVVAIDPVQIRRHKVVLGLGKLRITSKVDNDKLPITYQITNKRSNQLSKSLGGAQAETFLDTKRYTVEAMYDGSVQRKAITIKPSLDNTLNFDFRSAQLNVRSATQGSGKPVKVLWKVEQLDDKGQSEGVVRRGKAESQQFTLAAGKYRVFATYNKVELKRDISLQAGQEKTENFAFSMGKLRVSAAGALEGPLEWVVYSLNAQGKPQKLVATEVGLVGSFNLPAGKYMVFVRQNGIEAKKAVEVTSGKLTIVRVPMTGTLKLKALQSENGKPVYVRWQVYRIVNGELGPEVARGQRSRQQFALAAGKYRIVAKHAVAESSVTVSIKPGQNIEKTVILGFGELILQAFNAEGGDPLFVEWSVFKVTPEGNVGEQLSRSERTSRAMTLAAGTYHVKVAYKGLKQEANIILDPGKRTVKPFFFNSGLLNLEALKSPNGGPLFAELSIFKKVAGKPNEQVAQIRKAKHQFVLPEGKYHVIARHKNQEVTSAITIKAGANQTKKLAFSYADLQLTAYLKRGGEPSFVEWSIFKLNKNSVGEEVVRATRASQSFTLPAGRYRVSAQRLSKSGNTLQRDLDITLRAGRTLKKSIYLDIGQLNLKAFADGDGKDVRWEIFEAKANGARGKRIKSLKGNVANVDLPAGKYHVVAVSGGSRHSSLMTVKPGRTVTQGEFLIGNLRLTASAAKGQPALFSSWEVYRLQNNKPVAQVAKTNDTILTLSLPAGKYRAIAEYSGIKRQQDFAMKAGKNNEQTLLLGLGNLQVTALESRKGAKAYVEWEIYRLDNNGKREEQIVHDAGPERKFELREGQYEVVARHKLGERHKKLKVLSGKTTKASLSLDIGELAFDIVEYKGASPLVSHWRLYHLGNNKRILIGEDHSPRHKQKVLAGKYELEVLRDGNRTKKKIEVIGGKTTKQLVNFELGQLALHAVQYKNGPNLDVKWELSRTVGAQQVNMLSTTTSDQKLTLPQGMYALKITHAGGTTNKQLRVNQGKLTRYEFSQDLSDLTVVVVFGAGSDSVPSDITIKPLGKSGYVKPVANQDARFKLTAGRYEITAKHPLKTVKKRISVLAGKEVTETISLNLATLNLSARQQQGERPVTASWVVYSFKGNKPVEVIKTKDSDVSKVLPQGKYRVVVTRDEQVKRKMIVLRAGKTYNEVFAFEQGNLSINAKLSDNEDIVVDWKITRQGRKPRVIKEARAGKLSFKLDAGRYTAEATYASRTVKKAFKITPSKPLNLTLTFPVALLNVSAFDVPNGRQIPVRWELFELKNGKIGNRIADQSKSRVMRVKIAPGEYELRARSGATVLKRKLKLTDKQIKNERLVFSGVVKVSAYEAKRGKPVSVQWSVSRIKSGGVGEPIDTSISASRAFTLPAGLYEFKGVHDAREVKAEINVVAGKRVERRFDLDIGSLELKALRRRGGTPVAVQWQVFQLLKNDTVGRLVTESIRESRRFVLPAGRYRIRGKHDDRAIEADITIRPGQHVVREFLISQGVLKLKAIDAATKKGLRVKWLIHKEDVAQNIGKMVTRGIGDDVEFKLASGTYRVIMKYRSMVGEATVKVRSGQTSKEQFVLHVK